MTVFEQMSVDNYEQVVFCQEKTSGLKAIIAIHDTTLGPALGGTRMWNYENEETALHDVLRLAKGMTYKNAAAGLNFGGGKAVIIGDARKHKNEAMLRAFGRYVHGLNGRYVTAVDVGMTGEDIDTIQLETPFATGSASSTGSSGNPSPVTAYGVYLGMKAAVKEAFGSDMLQGKTIAVQGVGNVAYQLCEYLHREGASLIVTDIYEPSVERAVKDFGAKAVGPEEIYEQPCDVFAPCALGGVINDETIEQIRASVIAGAANNQLKETKHGDILYEKGVIYAPDFVLNAGGVINISDEVQGYNRSRAMKKVEAVYEQMGRVFEVSKRDHIPSYLAANRMAEERIASVRAARNSYLRVE